MNDEELELLRSNFLGSENYLITYLKNYSGNTDKIKDILKTLRKTSVSKLKVMAQKNLKV